MGGPQGPDDFGIGVDTLNGGAGNDLMRGGQDTGVVYGGSGDDTLFIIFKILGFGDNVDTYDGGDDIDTADLSGVTVEGAFVNLASGIWGLPTYGSSTIVNVENVEGGTQADTLTGNDVGNILNGNDGDDVIVGGNGADTMTGGLGDDTITDTSFDGGANTVSGDDGDDHLINTYAAAGGLWDGGAGKDTIDFSPDSSADASYIDMSSGWFVLFSTTFQNIEHIIGHQDVDFIIGSNVGNLIDGKSSNDELRGLSGSDRLFGRGGDDLIEGGTGKDKLNGGLGIDTLSYAASSLGVTVDLAEGTATGGNAAGDTFAAFENLTGSAKSDALAGSGHANTILGLGASDVLVGAGGNDVLDGGNGRDRLDGGDGFDRLVGGGGADTLVLSPIRTSNDVILSFSGLEDSLEVSATAFGGGLTASATLADSQLVLSTTGRAADRDTRFILNTLTGDLYFHTNGTLSGERVLIATFEAIIPTLTTADFVIV